MANHFGEHITIDGYGGNPTLLDSHDNVLACLTGLCDALNMHPLSEPCVFSAPDNNLKDPGGWSGFLVIAESHISVHTFPKRRFLSADVYTCQNGIEEAGITDFFRRAFELEEVETNFIVRGLKYPSQNIACLGE